MHLLTVANLQVERVRAELEVPLPPLSELPEAERVRQGYFGGCCLSCLLQSCWRACCACGGGAPQQGGSSGLKLLLPAPSLCRRRWRWRARSA